ncbi:MAG: fumarylacetoacetate hydrolase family protein [Bacteroidota bacterium]|jgi:2-keto-4-pentenoate hydratase/2-oxohepta-3-ene-1,7-dioic acid hydratase in catechol pathway|nr:fumarylacetoacetate hydrolase family protein [Bacteroidota bacterium]
MPFINLLPDHTRVDVGTIYCIGRNYIKHIRELENEVSTEPVLFLKPAASLITQLREIELPAFSADVHHEAEMVLLIGREGRNIPEEHARHHIAGIAVGLDLTARDTQHELKEKGLPWAISKGFETAACVSDFLPTQSFEDFADIHFSLQVNGVQRQEGDTSLMIFPVPRLLAFISAIVTLEPGDLIFTGTPHGVGAIAPGDRLDLAMGELSATFTVARR